MEGGRGLGECYICHRRCQRSELTTSAVTPQGAKKQGIVEHVKVKKKFDSQGVGAVSMLMGAFRTAHAPSCQYRYAMRGLAEWPVQWSCALLSIPGTHANPGYLIKSYRN